MLILQTIIHLGISLQLKYISNDYSHMYEEYSTASHTIPSKWNSILANS